MIENMGEAKEDERRSLGSRGGDCLPQDLRKKL